MAPSDSSPTKPQDVLGNGKSQNEIGAIRIQEQKDNEVENDKNAKPSSFNQPEPYANCDLLDYGFSDDQWHEPISPVPSEVFGYDSDYMYAEEAENSTCYNHVNNGGSLKEGCDENSHVEGGNNGEAESSSWSTRVIHVPFPKVGLVVGAVATLRYLQPNLGDRIRILKDDTTKCGQRPMEITGNVAQIEFAEQLIEAVLKEENHEEPMEEETEKPSSQKDGESLIEQVQACDSNNVPKDMK